MANMHTRIRAAHMSSSSSPLLRNMEMDDGGQGGRDDVGKKAEWYCKYGGKEREAAKSESIQWIDPLFYYISCDLYLVYLLHHQADK